MKTYLFSVLFLVALSATTNAQQNPTKVECVTRADGGKEIRLSDASGKIITTITANKGESLQTKYADYIAKQPKPQNTTALAPTNSKSIMMKNAGDNSKATEPKRSDPEDKK